MYSQLPVERFDASNGAQIFRLPLEVFPGYSAFAHLIKIGDDLTLVDVGSGFGRSHTDLMAGFQAIREHHNLPVSFEALDTILITHGHIDHFGGIGQVKELAPAAAIAAHELDRVVLMNYDERVLVTSKRLSEFFTWAGVPSHRYQPLMDMYLLGKRAFKSVPVDLALQDGDELPNGLRVIHVPGHTPGLLMVQVGDILLTSDHILPKTSVALAPERLMPYTGVGHYLESLQKASTIEDVRVALGGHEEPMYNYYEVVQRTFEQSLEKIQKVLEHCDEPRTIYDIAARIYGTLDGYSELLKLEQTGARIEYLNQRGMVMVDNLDALEANQSVPLRYRRA